MLAEGQQPDHRALHPSVFEFIQQRGLYGLHRAAAAGSSASDTKAAPITAAPRPSSANAPCTQDPPSSASAPAARPSPWGTNSKSALVGGLKGASAAGVGGGHTHKTGGGSPKAAAEPCTPQAIAAEINAELAHGPLTRRCHVVVLFGAHGTGKGSVAEALCSRRNYKHVSFGACALM